MRFARFFLLLGVASIIALPLWAQSPSPSSPTPNGVTTPAEELSAAEKQVLRSDAEIIRRATEAGDGATIVAMTHPALVQAVGGPEKFAALVRNATQQIQAAKVKIVDSHLGVPSPVYRAGETRLCFLPKTTLIETGGKRAKSVTYLVAIQSPGSPRWLYLDGTGMRHDPQLLWRFFPLLSRDVPLPPNTVEVIK